MLHLTALYGTAWWLVLLELGLAAALSLFATVRQKGSGVGILLSLLICAALLNHAFSSARPLLAVGLIMPGSFLTRFLVVDIAPWLRRWVEPSLWIFVIGWCLAVASWTKSRASYLGFAAALFVCLALFIEALSLAPLLSYDAFGCELMNAYLWMHLALSQLALVCMLIFLWKVLFGYVDKVENALTVGSNLKRLIFWGVSMMAGFSLLLVLPRPAPQKVLVGAHYYSWFPENWSHGYVGAKLKPPVKPLLGEYDSANREVFSKHVQWARDSGIDFFIFDWWPKRKLPRKRIYSHVKKGEQFRDFRFAMHYETLDLKEAHDPTFPGETENIVFFTDVRAWRLKKHWEYLAIHYMKRPGYLRINGKAVLFVYATRHLTGPVSEAIRAAKKHVHDTTGVDLYLIADEMYFNVIGYSAKKGIHLLKKHVPNWERLSAFDAIGVYNPYDSSRVEHGGSRGVQRFVSDVRSLYKQYRAVAATLGIQIVPGVIPGYNDRGVRPAENHYVIPRFLSTDSRESLFEASIKELILPVLDRRDPMFTITSWNEWNEGTNIEPTAASARTMADISPSGRFYSQFEQHLGYGFQYLEELKTILSSVSDM